MKSKEGTCAKSLRNLTNSLLWPTSVCFNGLGTDEQTRHLEPAINVIKSGLT